MTISKSGFQQTEIGLIPIAWSCSPIAGVTKQVASGKSNARVSTGSFPVFGSTGQIGFSNQYDYEGQRILVARVGANAGAVNIVSGQYCVSDNTLMIQMQKNCEALYLFFYLKYFNLNQLVFGSGQPLITGGQIKSLKIPLPPLPEQTAIAEALSDADALITSLEKLIEKKRAIKQGAMQELLTGKRRLPGFSGKWEVKKLGEIGESIIGLTYKPSDVSDNGLLVLRSSNIGENKLKFDDNVYVNLEVSEKIINREGDILICVRNGSRSLIGKCAYISGSAVGQTFGAFMAMYRSPYNKFIFHVFQSSIIKRQIDENIGATINQITNKNLNGFSIPFPKNAEQVAIAEVLSDMDAEIEALEQKLAKYRQIKQGMMQELLTGRIRLV